MSFNQNITAKAHIVGDKDVVGKALEGILGGSADSNRGTADREERVVDGDGCTDALVTVSGSGLSGDIEKLDAALRAIGALGNGSYGLMIVESDFGIDAFDCYGAVELAPAGAVDGSRVWSSEDFLSLRVSMAAAQWAAFLQCDAASIAKEVEGRGDGLLADLLPSAAAEALASLEDVRFEYHDIDPYNSDGEAYDEAEDVSVEFDLDGHELNQAAFDAVASAVNAANADPAGPGAKVLLRLENAAETDGLFVNKMLDADSLSLLEFETSWRGVGDVRVLEPRALH